MSESIFLELYSLVFAQWRLTYSPRLNPTFLYCDRNNESFWCLLFVTCDIHSFFSWGYVDRTGLDFVSLRHTSTSASWASRTTGMWHHTQLHISITLVATLPVCLLACLQSTVNSMSSEAVSDSIFITPASNVIASTYAGTLYIFVGGVNQWMEWIKLE